MYIETSSLVDGAVTVIVSVVPSICAAGDNVSIGVGFTVRAVLTILPLPISSPWMV